MYYVNAPCCLRCDAPGRNRVPPLPRIVIGRGRAEPGSTGRLCWQGFGQPLARQPGSLARPSAEPSCESPCVLIPQTSASHE